MFCVIVSFALFLDAAGQSTNCSGLQNTISTYNIEDCCADGTLGNFTRLACQRECCNVTCNDIDIVTDDCYRCAELGRTFCYV